MRACKVCKTRFEGKGFVTWCGPACGTQLALARLEKKRQAQAKAERKTDRERKVNAKRRADWLKDAENAVNGYIHARDKDQPCVSCGCVDAQRWNASHYRSVGSSPALRYDPANIHRACVRCNKHLHGNLIPYRPELVRRIGQAEVDRLEGPQPTMKYTIEDLKQIIQTYRAKTKELMK